MIYAKSKDSNIIKKLLKEGGYEYHSFTASAEKTHAFISKGLDQAPEPDDVNDALLSEYNIPPKKVYRLSTMKGNHTANYSKCPVYLKRLELIDERNANSNRHKTSKTQYVSAPIPKGNAWNNRAEEQKEERKRQINVSKLDAFRVEQRRLKWSITKEKDPGRSKQPLVTHPFQHRRAQRIARVRWKK
ncbi:hypothetical protein JTB14_032184 [Gonioctena quinquepunctata]|nr:hypothetical protein JTB14_032184 [Gonioctena quinquepunctata]